MLDCNIVVIDDDNITLELMQIVLEEVTSGTIVAYEDSRQALEFIKSSDLQEASLVICDWLMPDVSGLDILAALREVSPECPFLMVTANATKELVVNAMKMGATDFIVKPFQTNRLLDKVEELVRNAS